ncbi:MAG: hypothetical protein KAW89_10435 [Armatimonadetes bacterium]|nr:hypothetical protein [Armatimonadota bacterium]
MRRDTAVWLLVVAVLAMVLFAGCGKSKKSESTQPQAMAPPMPGQMPGAYAPRPPGMPGQMPGAYGPQAGAYPGAYGPQAMQPAPMQAAEPEEEEPSGPGYKELYEQGDLTNEELREEHELQEVERELGYPVGPE